MAHKRQKKVPVEGELMQARPGVKKPALDVAKKVGRKHRVGPEEPIKAAQGPSVGKIDTGGSGSTESNSNPVPLKRVEKRARMNDGKNVFDMSQNAFDKAQKRVLDRKKSYGGMKPF